MHIRVEGLVRDHARDRGGRRTERPGSASPAALQGVTVRAEQGRMLALVGASGSGKTTLLRCIAGLDTPDEGEIEIGGRCVYSRARAIDVPPDRRELALIFQSYALWPHLSVTDNVAYPLRRRRLDAGEIARRVRHYLEMVGCAELGQRYAHQLSGGQQQRVALARALVYEPAVVLFDEPLSNLDAALRLHLRAQIRELQRRAGFTGIYVTHDQEEAFYLGDQVALLRQGRLVQSGTPQELYRAPADAQAAAFVGAENQASGWLREGGRWFESTALGRIATQPRAAASGTTVSDGPARIALRPESVTLAPANGGATARVLDRIAIGSRCEWTLALADGTRWRVLQPLAAASFEVGDTVSLHCAPEDVLVFAQESPTEARP